MSTIVYRIYAVLCQILARVPLGTNLGLLHLLFALVSGRFLSARGAVFPALASLPLPAPAVRRSAAALRLWSLELVGLARLLAADGCRRRRSGCPSVMKASARLPVT